METMSRTWRHASPVQSQPRQTRCRRITCRAVYQTEAGLPPPPPPPPPPAPGQGTSRRGMLQRFGGFGAAAAAGGLVGYMLGSRSSGAAGGLTAAERGEVDELRQELNLRRDYDGHVFVRDGKGSWWEVRGDAKLPGTLLLRDPQDALYFLTFSKVQQIDLSDDYVVGSLFAGGEWQALVQRVQARDDVGAVVDVKLDRQAFRDIISIID